ncbi:recombinase family protein [Spirosoma flavum]|uniref:Recombinase family protein n=1 Tax=Spirosoma flavum TaxID=2048557 RepID=A0ABW6AVH8_9BACT
MVARFFRLGRSRNHLIQLIIEFARKGIHFKALDLGVDSSTPAGKLVLQIFASLAEYDRESILEKRRAGQLLLRPRASTSVVQKDLTPKNLPK